MKAIDVDEVIACLDEKQTVHFYKDKYAVNNVLYLLDSQQRESITVKTLKATPYQAYLKKPVFQSLLQQCGDGRITRDHLKTCWATMPTHSFVTTLDKWGSGVRHWDQTTRNQCNLVLQLNFSNQHDALYRRLIKPENECGEGPFEYRAHPVHKGRRNTLAWARLDIDLDTGEALIEEIQMDWLRYVQRSYRRIQWRRQRDQSSKPNEVWFGINGRYQDYETYVKHVTDVYQGIWAEAMLTEAINFIRYTLGIHTIYYHTYDTGRQLKKVGGHPPRSLYTRLPKQFGFKVTEEVPHMLKDSRYVRHSLKKIKQPQWFVC